MVFLVQGGQILKRKMSSEDVAKAVAKRLKYYLDMQRREDAFDLSGPQHPERDHPVSGPGSSLAYEGLHDRSLKHYYRNKNVKQQLQKMKTGDGALSREKQVKKKIEKTMQDYNYRLTPNTISPYAVPLIHPKDTSLDDLPLKQRRGTKKKKHARMIVGKTPKVGRRAPDEIVSPLEKERLVNMATKLIVATETIALPQHVRKTRGNQTDALERLPVVPGGDIARRTSSASDPGPRATPQPPKHKHQSRRHPPGKKWNDTSSGEISLDSTLDSVRSQMQHMKLDPRGNGFLISYKDQSLTSSAERSAASQTKTRPKSAGDHLSQSHTDSDYEDFYDNNSPNVSPMTSPRSEWKATDPPQSMDNATQTVETKGTQTVQEPFAEATQIQRSTFVSRSSSQHTQYDDAISNSGTQVEEGVQAAPPPEMKSKVLAYEIFVVTGDKLGAGTSSDVKIDIFGQYGSSGERPLLRSKSNKNPFERKQVDLFLIDSIFLGDLTSIRIGHNGTALGTGWFLDRVVIREGNDATRAFEFKCGRWLSARDDDGQIVRDLPLASELKGDEIPKIKDAKRTFFKYRPDSASSIEGGKRQFRPLSASQKKDSDLKPSSIASTGAEDAEAKKKPERKYFTANHTDSSTDEESKEKTAERGKDRQPVKDEEESGRVANKEQGNYAKEGEKDEADLSDSKENNKQRDIVKQDRKGKKPRKTKGDDENENSKSVEKIPEKDADLSHHSGDEISETNEEKGELPDEDREEEKKSRDVDDPAFRQLNEGDSKNSKTTADEEEIKPVEEKVAETENNDEDSDNSSDDSSSSSGSELFSVSSDSGSSSDSVEDEDKGEKSDDDDEEVERVPKDTTKKEDSDSEARKTSTQDDYMAGFMAAIKAQKEGVPKEEPEESVLTKGPNIHQASENGDFDRIKELIAEVPDLKNKPDERGWTPLHIVTGFGYLDILKWLSVNGVNLTEETPTGFSAIHLAAMNGHVKCLMVLAAMGCPLSCRTVDESTPLHLAAMSGHTECVKWLLANRANPNVRDANGRTPYELAAEYQHEACAELLELMAKELTRKDSVISKLRHPNTKDVEDQASASSKGTDSGIGGAESGEDGWISDTEEDVIGRGDHVQSAKSRGENFAAAKARRKSKQEERAIEEKEEKRKIYEKQREKMQRRESSFLDSIRQEIDSDENDDF